MKSKNVVKKIKSCRKRRGCAFEPYELMLGKTFEAPRKKAA